tara:strand:- start:122 stop:304 length:183 start_codon:yes stop_codon:yes gene_type:complete
MVEINELQEKSLLRKWEQDNQSMTYEQFKGTVARYIGGDCVVVWHNGTLFGIETDGYTHS